MSFIYPGGDEQVTPNLGLATWGMDEVLAENMILIDAAIGGPTGSIKINGSVVPATNFINSASVTFTVVGSNVSATATSAGSAAWASLTGDLTETQVIPWDGPTPGTPDTGISRIGAASLAIGNGTAASIVGTLTLGSLIVSAVSGATHPFKIIDIGTGFAGVDLGGGTTNPALYGTSSQTILNASSQVFLEVANAPKVFAFSTGVGLSSGPLIWSSTLNANGTADTGISRLGAASLGVGNGTAGDVTGSLSAQSIRMPGAGTGTVFNLQFGATTNTGLYYNGSAVVIGYAGTVVAQWNASAFNIFGNNLTIGTSGAGISSLGAASLAIGNGTAGNFSGNLKLTGINNLGTYTDGAGSVGTSGQVLTSTATATAWVSAASIGTAWSSLTGTLSNGQVIPYADAGISRLGAASLAIGNGTASDITGNLSLNRINKAGADFAGQATVTAGSTTKAVAFSANYTGTGQPVITLTPTSDPLAAGLPVGYWVTYSGGAGAWTGFTVNIQTALAGNVTFNYIVVGVA